jgi:hypothetical protein
MKEVVDAAVSAAGRSGLRATVIVLEANGPTLGHAESTVVGATTPVRDDSELIVLRGQHDQLARLRDQIASERDQIKGDRDGLSARVRELEARLAQAAATNGAQTSAPAVGDGKMAQPTAVAAFEATAVSLLNLDEKVLKLCEKQGWATVGHLRDALLTGKLKEHKVADKVIVGVAERLLGRVDRLEGQAVIAAKPAAGDSGVPVGHVDRPWLERLEACRRKEQKRRDLLSSIAKLEAEIAAPHPPDEQAMLQKKRDAEKSVLSVTNAQVIAMLFSMGLNHNLQEVDGLDGALKQAGLVQFMQTPPAPVTDVAPAASEG